MNISLTKFTALGELSGFTTGPSHPAQALCHLCVTLVTPDSFESRATVTRAGDMVTSGVVHALTYLLTPVAKGSWGTSCVTCTVQVDSETEPPLPLPLNAEKPMGISQFCPTQCEAY